MSVSSEIERFRDAPIKDSREWMFYLDESILLKGPRGRPNLPKAPQRHPNATWGIPNTSKSNPECPRETQETTPIRKTHRERTTLDTMACKSLGAPCLTGAPSLQTSLPYASRRLVSTSIMLVACFPSSADLPERRA